MLLYRFPAPYTFLVHPSPPPYTPPKNKYPATQNPPQTEAPQKALHATLSTASIYKKKGALHATVHTEKRINTVDKANKKTNVHANRKKLPHAITKHLGRLPLLQTSRVCMSGNMCFCTYPNSTTSTKYYATTSLKEPRVYSESAAHSTPHASNTRHYSVTIPSHKKKYNTTHRSSTGYVQSRHKILRLSYRPTLPPLRLSKALSVKKKTQP
jgi:hypothetical protein